MGQDIPYKHGRSASDRPAVCQLAQTPHGTLWRAQTQPTVQKMKPLTACPSQAKRAPCRQAWRSHTTAP